VLDKLSTTITNEQYTQLMKIVDPTQTGRISYHQFLDIFEERETKVMMSFLLSMLL